eukprot:CAMPEP_0118953750 /NCGR_PEP_ID=MMETSP1169-20130426/57110_1 /TAXON_ID=36882 /ORGANISM="Pyramimonas obovata, Strain CCMP722" /LENGTH=328 /DNA_ID=CAMNT_0006901283 /DNA_START=81 /DNA_END=1064 /DNA_ORIENTATION=-
MGVFNALFQGITSTQFYLYGRKRFTATGWEEASKAYKAGQLENAELSSKVYLVTGANAGIGREVTEYLASKGGKVYMVCRDKERAEKAKDHIVERTSNKNVNVLLGDCGLQRDVRRIFEEFGRKEQRLDGLVCNAGALLDEKTLSKEGVEVTFATHLLYGCYLYTKLAIPFLEQSGDPRVVMVSSGGMYNTKFPKWEVATSTSSHKYDGQLAYAYAKRGQVLLAEQWAKTYRNIKFVTCHPGWTDTPGVAAAYGDKKKYLEPMRSMYQGSEGISWLCATPGAELESGAFYLDRSPQRKHLSGMFFSDGSFTKNTDAEVDAMMQKLEEW